MKSQGKVKLFIILAIVIILLLFVISIIQIVSIYDKKRTIAEQKEEISRLEEELGFWENKDNNDTSIDNDVVIEESI